MREIEREKRKKKRKRMMRFKIDWEIESLDLFFHENESNKIRVIVTNGTSASYAAI